MTMKCEKVKEYIGQYLNQCYKNQKFCDVTIVADSTQIQCHKIVLASVSPFLKDVLTSPGQNEDVDGNTVLNLSEFNPKEVKYLIDNLYSGLVSKNDVEINNVDQSLCRALRISDIGCTFQENTLLRRKRTRQSFSVDNERKPKLKKRSTVGEEVSSKDCELGGKDDSQSRVSDVQTLKTTVSTPFSIIKSVPSSIQLVPADDGAFQCLVAISTLSEASRAPIATKVLAWTHPDSHKVLEQVIGVKRVAKQLLKVSEVMFDLALASKINIYSSSQRSKVQEELLEELSSQKQEALKARLAVIKETLEMTADDSKASIDIDNVANPPTNLDLQVIPDLSLSALQHLAILAFDASTASPSLHVLPLPASATDLLENLFQVWNISPKSLAKNEPLMHNLSATVKMNQEREAIERILNEPSSKLCSECGERIPYLTRKDKTKYRNHQERHQRENFDCDCEANLGDKHEKRRHILLQHSAGRYTQCSKCAYIGTTNQVETHEQSNHKPYICDVCGKSVPSKAALSVHILDHKTYTCEKCGLVIVGRHKYTRHIDTNHTGNHTCEVCGNVFKSRSYMLKHVSIMHQSDEAKPHRCEVCGKGFVTSNSLKTHRMNVHIKSRPYACRYGCGAAYNDSSNRGHHERKKHGGNWDPTRQQPFQQQHPPIV